MLLLSRCTNESIVIGEDIEVKIARIDGTSVCLAIQAPREIPINRKEVLNQIKSVMNHKK